MELRDSRQALWLFETKAIKVSPEDKPFWYTSGTIGPYYVNTHFLLGSEKEANELLMLIDKVKNEKSDCSSVILSKLKESYRRNHIYRELIDYMVSYIMKNFDIHEIDYISGGERRDWFFSLMVADILNKPHITLFKDLSAMMFDGEYSREISCIHGKKLLHVADIITEASSYIRQWIPAIRKLSGSLKWSLAVADRLQGGGENLAANGVQSHAIIRIDSQLFDNALFLGFINQKQHKIITEYIKNPRETMRDFLIQHPEFIRNSLDADAKTSERARICIEKDPYDLRCFYSTICGKQ